MTKVIIAILSIFFLIGCGSSSSSEETQEVINKIPFGTFSGCVVEIEEDNLYGAKAIVCEESKLDSGWSIQRADILDSDGFTAYSDIGGDVEALTIKTVTPYTITDGEEHNLIFSITGKNEETSEQRKMEGQIIVKGVPPESKKISPETQYPVLVIRINLTDANISNTEQRASNITFGFDLDQMNHAMLRNSASTRTFIPAAESYGTANDGIITVDLNRSTFPSGSYGDFALVTSYAEDAIKLADPFINFSSFDVDGDGVLIEKELSIVTVFPEDSLYNINGHAAFSSNSFSNSYDSDDGIRVILKDYPSTNMVVFVDENDDANVRFHELGHTIWGLIDLYDIDYSSNGTGDFGLMDGGVNKRENNYKNPEIMMAYSQVSSGFLSPQAVTSTQRVTLYPATMETHHNIIKVSSNRSDEFFYLENFLFSHVRPRPESAEDALDSIGGIFVTKINTGTSATSNYDDDNRIVDVVYPDEKESQLSYEVPPVETPFFDETDSIQDIKYSDGNSSGISINNITFNGDGSISADITIQ